MSEKRISERETVLRERAAFVRGGATFSTMNVIRDLDGVAAIEYPLPKRIVPRVWSEPHSGLEYRVIDGKVQSKFIDHSADAWRESPYDKRFRNIADLLANPTTTEDDPGHE